MWAKSSNFLAVVEWGKVWISDEEPFSNTQFANFGHWIEWLCSVKNFPVHFPCGSPRLAFPNVCAKDSFMFVVRIVERLIMVSPSRFEVRGAADVLFWNRLLNGQYLTNSGEAQLKKTTLYVKIIKISHLLTVRAKGQPHHKISRVIFEAFS